MGLRRICDKCGRDLQVDDRLLRLTVSPSRMRGIDWLEDEGDGFVALELCQPCARGMCKAVNDYLPNRLKYVQGMNDGPEVLLPDPPREDRQDRALRGLPMAGYQRG